MQTEPSSDELPVGKGYVGKCQGRKTIKDNQSYSKIFVQQLGGTGRACKLLLCKWPCRPNHSHEGTGHPEINAGFTCHRRMVSGNNPAPTRFIRKDTPRTGWSNEIAWGTGEAGVGIAEDAGGDRGDRADKEKGPKLLLGPFENYWSGKRGSKTALKTTKSPAIRAKLTSYLQTPTSQSPFKSSQMNRNPTRTVKAW
jgi:hypothetical protein